MAQAILPYDDLVWACTNLCDLLEYENEALRNHDVDAIRGLAHNKNALARIYTQSVAPMADEPALAEELEQDQKDELMGLGLRLKTLVEENAMRLRAEMEATQRFMDAVVSAVKSNAINSVNYDRIGGYEVQANGEKNSIAFNRTL